MQQISSFGCQGKGGLKESLMGMGIKHYDDFRNIPSL